jgi:hypothetical protein
MYILLKASVFVHIFQCSMQEQNLWWNNPPNRQYYHLSEQKTDRKDTDETKYQIMRYILCAGKTPCILNWVVNED